MTSRDDQLPPDVRLALYGTEGEHCERDAAARITQAVAGSAGEEPIDWRAFVPSAEIQEAAKGSGFVDGDIIATWSPESRVAGQRGAVRRISNQGTIGTRLAGDGPSWYSRRARLIRHADGTWADGANPSGWCQAGCGVPGASSKNWDRIAASITNRTAYCTPFCADRAKAKAAEKARRPPVLDEADLWKAPAEPSREAGQVPSAPLRYERGWLQCPRCSVSCAMEAFTGFWHCQSCGWRPIADPPVAPSMMALCLEMVNRRPGTYCQLRRGHEGRYAFASPPAPPAPATGTPTSRYRLLSRAELEAALAHAEARLAATEQAKCPCHQDVES